jgi:hypothetical protein
MKYKLREFYYNIRDFFNPRQKWLTQKIPNHWIDKDTLWEICIFEGIKHYVEKDGGLGHEVGDYESSQNDPTFPEWQKKFNREVKQNYELITQRLPALEKDFEEAWKKIPHFEIGEVGKIDYEKVYGEVNRLEEQIHSLKTSIMFWVIFNRNSIWT